MNGEYKLISGMTLRVRTVEEHPDYFDLVMVTATGITGMMGSKFKVDFSCEKKSAPKVGDEVVVNVSISVDEET